MATDPPYNPQLKLTMAGGKLAEEFANRRTDYAMVTPTPADLANSATYEEYLDAHGGGLRRAAARAAGRSATQRSSSATPTRTAATASPASDLAARAERVGFVTKGDLVWYQAGARLRPYGYPRGFVPNIVHQHILVLRAG